MTDQTHVEAALDRIARLNPPLHAFRLPTPELARQAAWAQERNPSAGPLAGRLLAIKDLFDLRGTPTGGGARTPVIEEAARTAPAVNALLDAGLIPVGKAETVELALGSWGINRATRTPRNPWDAAAVRVPGGSSAGTAVAVAAGLADLGLGSDSGGSIRIPSALNGLTGLKPTWGRVALAGCLPLSPSLDTAGPLAWSVADAAHMLACLSRTGDLPPFDAAESLRAAAGIAGKRLAVLADSALSAVSDPVGEAYLQAVSRLERLGARLVEVRPPLDPAAMVEPTGALLAAEGWRCWQTRVEQRGGEMDPGVLSRLQVGAAIDDQALSRLHAARAGDQGRFHAWLQEVEALLTPTVPVPAPTLAEADESALPFSRFTRMANWLNLPALALPMGFTPAGLPLSLQILALPGCEARVVGVGQAYQQTTDWHRRRPVLDALTAAAVTAPPRAASPGE